MAVSGAVGLLGLVLQAASQLRELGNSWYKVSNEWDSFPEKVDRLREKHDLWKAAFVRVGMLSDDALATTLLSDDTLRALRSAKSLLDIEQERLNKRLRHNCKCCLKTRSTIFPSTLGLSIQRVTDSLDHILSTLQLEDDVAIAIDKRVLRTTFSFRVKNDDRFVPLERTEHRICEALDNPQGPIVVGLHGGAGKGKSTLARHIAVHYKGRRGEDGVFDHVFFLDCGPQENTLVIKQLELLNQLGFVSNEAGEEARFDFAVSTQKRLAARLKNAKILIILDDVWQAEFVMGFVNLFGSGVKCLITAQSEDLCRAITQCLPIHIEDISQEDARKVLASHVGFPDKLIPANLQDIADKMIEETQANPLALASLANAIPPRRSTEIKQWEATYQGLFGLLERELPKLTFGARYPRSFWAAIRLSMKSLKDENAQKLLILRSMCRGTSISQDVIQFLYGSKNFGGDLKMFIHLRNALETTEWLQISGESEVMSPSWSLHVLRQQFIMKDRRDTIDSILASFAIKNPRPTADPHTIRTIDHSSSEKERTVFAMVSIFYLERSFAEKMHATSQIPIPLENFNDLKRIVIEPLLWLLAQPLTGLDHHFVVQVFLEYVQNGILDDDGASNLLASPASTVKVLVVLHRAAGIAKSPFLDENKHGVMKVLVDLLKDDANPQMQHSTTEVLAALATPAYHRGFILDFPGVLDILVQRLSMNGSNLPPQTWASRLSMNGNLSPETWASQLAAAQTWVSLRALAHLARGEVGEKLKILNYPGALELLIECISEHKNVKLQRDAACVLANLTSDGKETISKTLNWPGALEGLTEAMAKNRDVIVQGHAIAALAHLANGEDDAKLKILNCPRALEGLIESISEDRVAIIQIHATGALANLGSGGEDTNLKILNCPGALEGLIESTSKDRDAIVQRYATRALANLATVGEETKLKILNGVGALEGLIESMSKDRDAIVQEQAIVTLANLTGVGEETDLKILNIPGFLEGLIESISKDKDAIVQGNAIRALACLVSSGDGTRLKVLNCPGAIEGLIESMCVDRDTIIQRQATRALVNLVAGGDDIQLKILNCRGALEGLIESMSKDRDEIVQGHATRALANLTASGEERNKLKLLNCSRALGALIESMSKERVVIVQGHATGALANLARSGEEIKLKILNCRGAIEGLIESISKDRDAIVQRHAIAALAHLAGVGEETDLKMLNCPGALQGLIESMSKDRDVIIQRQATLALAKLIDGGEDIKLMKILNYPWALESLIESIKDKDAIVQSYATYVLANLATGGEEIKLKILNCRGALEGLIESLSKDRNVLTQEQGARALFFLAIGDCGSLRIKEREGLIDRLVSLLSEHVPEVTQFWTASTLTLIDPVRGNEVTLHSTSAYAGRGRSNLWLGMLHEAAADLDVALAEADAYKVSPCDLLRSMFSVRCTVKAKLNDFQGAMEDANTSIQFGGNLTFGLQERGVLKRMLGDLHGALADLNEALELNTEDYEILKHRGYVKFLLKDEEGAHYDAEWAQRIRPQRVDCSQYGGGCLGETSVEYMGFMLK